MEETIKLKCEKCQCDYEKPSVFKEYLVTTKYNVFYRWSLAFCVICRRKKQKEALKNLPSVLKALGESFEK
jgi:hypothetical protein